MIVVPCSNYSTALSDWICMRTGRTGRRERSRRQWRLPRRWICGKVSHGLQSALSLVLSRLHTMQVCWHCWSVCLGMRWNGFLFVLREFRLLQEFGLFEFIAKNILVRRTSSCMKCLDSEHVFITSRCDTMALLLMTMSYSSAKTELM